MTWCEQKHGFIPAEPWQFKWTTTLLQVRDGAKWRKMMSSQADRTQSPSSCSTVWSTARVTLSTHLQQRPSTPKPKSENIGGREDESLGQYDQAAFYHLCVLSSQHLTFNSENGHKYPTEKPNISPMQCSPVPWVLWMHLLQLSLYAETRLIKSIVLCLAGNLQRWKGVKSTSEKRQC